MTGPAAKVPEINTGSVQLFPPLPSFGDNQVLICVEGGVYGLDFDFLADVNWGQRVKLDSIKSLLLGNEIPSPAFIVHFLISHLINGFSQDLRDWYIKVLIEIITAMPGGNCADCLTELIVGAY
jgi:hypothetical protein